MKIVRLYESRPEEVRRNPTILYSFMRNSFISDLTAGVITTSFAKEILPSHEFERYDKALTWGMTHSDEMDGWFRGARAQLQRQ